MCDLDDLEPCELWNERTVRARTPKVCTICRGVIAAGARYVRHFSKVDGEVESSRVCDKCEEARELFRQTHPGGVAPSGFRWVVEECLDDAPEPEAEMYRGILDGFAARAASKPLLVALGVSAVAWLWR